jgi:hypothetical protein
MTTDPRTPAVALSEEEVSLSALSDGEVVKAALAKLKGWLDEDNDGLINWDRIIVTLEEGNDIEPWLEKAAILGARAAAALRTAPASDDLAADAYIRRGLPVPWEARTAPAEGVAVPNYATEARHILAAGMAHDYPATVEALHEGHAPTPCEAAAIAAISRLLADIDGQGAAPPAADAGAGFP